MAALLYVLLLAFDQLRGAAPADLLQVNLHRYVFNNPLRYTDPTGHEPGNDPAEPTKGAAPDTTGQTRGDLGGDSALDKLVDKLSPPPPPPPPKCSDGSDMKCSN
ncbi:MAG: hypothetical protein HY237_06390 [Acidobacteria bacterium]|nr:hypothetical protein [Acidobacteriota bacterium]